MGKYLAVTISLELDLARTRLVWGQDGAARIWDSAKGLSGNHLREWSRYTFLKFREGKKINHTNGEQEIQFILDTHYSPFGL
jgi:hypothetical protein